MAEEELTPEEREQLWNYAQATGATLPVDSKINVHTFLMAVAKADDTTKTGFLEPNEIGIPQNPIRALKGFALICDDIIGNEMFAKHFRQQAEIITATSLSRGGFLDKLAVTQTRQLADVTKVKKENKGWFAKKDKPEKETEQL